MGLLCQFCTPALGPEMGAMSLVLFFFAVDQLYLTFLTSRFCDAFWVCKKWACNIFFLHERQIAFFTHQSIKKCSLYTKARYFTQCTQKAYKMCVIRMWQQTMGWNGRQWHTRGCNLMARSEMERYQYGAAGLKVKQLSPLQFQQTTSPGEILATVGKCTYISLGGHCAEFNGLLLAVRSWYNAAEMVECFICLK